jgi:hypothetical protein
MSRWSPNGKKILFPSAHAYGGGFGIGLATMSPDGNARRVNPAAERRSRCTIRQEQ